MGLKDYDFLLRPGYPDRMDKPLGIAEVLAAWNLPAREVAYLGDIPYDMQVARQMGLIALGAAWAETATVQTVNHGATDALFFQVADFHAWIETHIPLEQV
jgi:phosphoglycolate phosphatase-like HAD superfamily hydrolase